MKSKAQAFGLSLLDVVSCALGAVVLLAVLLSIIKTPIPPPVSNQFILVETSAKGVGQLGFIVFPPNSNGQSFVITPDMRQSRKVIDTLVGSGAVKLAERIEYRQSLIYGDVENSARRMAYLTLEKPVTGEWRIRPYFYEFDIDNRQLNSSPLKEINIRFFTQSGGGESMLEDDEGSEYSGPGVMNSHSNTVAIDITQV